MLCSKPIRKQRLFIRVLLTYFVLAAAMAWPYIPIYRAVYDIARDGVVKDSFNTMQAGFRDINEKIDTIYKNAYALQADASIRKLTHVSSPLKSSDYFTLLNAQRLLRSVTFTSDILFSSYLVFRENDVTLTNTQMFTDSGNMFTMYNNIPGMTYEKWREYLLDNESRMVLKPGIPVEYRYSVLDKPQKLDIIHCIISLPIDNLVYKDSAFVAMLDVSSILNALASEDIRNEGFLCLTDRNGTPLYAYRWDGDVLETSGRIEERTINGVQTTLLTVSDEESRIKVVAGIPSRVFAKKVDFVTGYLLIFLLSAILLGLFVSLFLARRQSRPLQSILDAIGGLFSHRDPSPGDPYLYIKDAFTEMNTSNQQYQRQIAVMNETVRIGMTYRLLHDDLFDSRLKAAYLKDLGFEDTCFCVALMTTTREPVLNDEDANHTEATSGERTNTETGNEMDQMASVVLVEWMAAHVKCRYVLHSLEPGKSVILFNLDNDSSTQLDEIEESLHAIASFLRMKIGIETRFVLSGMECGLDHVSKCYVQAKAALRFGDLSLGSTVLRCRREYATGSGTVFTPAMAVKLSELIVMGETERVGLSFLEIHDRLAQFGPLDAGGINRLLLSIQNTLNHTALQIGSDSAALPALKANVNDRPIRNVLGEQTQTALLLCTHAISRQHSRNTRLKDSVLTHLETHYSDSSLCVAQVAELFNLSEKYLFGFVKEHTGKSFGDFVESLRLKKAEELLNNTDDAINQLHERIGFNSQNTFYKVFKRVYGVSPGTWRTHHKNRQ